MGRDKAVRMAGRTLFRIKYCVVRPHRLKVNVAELPPMGSHRKIVGVKPAVTFQAEPFCVVATVAGRRVLLGLYGVYFPEIGPMRLRHVIGARLRGMQVGIDSASLMTIKAERKLMAVLTVIRLLVRVDPVFLDPSRSVVRCNIVGYVAFVAKLYLHVRSVVGMPGQRPNSRA